MEKKKDRAASVEESDKNDDANAAPATTELITTAKEGQTEEHLN